MKNFVGSICHSKRRVMIQICSIIAAIWIAYSTSCYGLQVEVNLLENSNFKSAGKKMRLICVPTSKKLNVKRKHSSIRSNKDTNSGFNKNFRHLPAMHSEVLLPGIMVNLSEGVKCFLSSSDSDLLNMKRRVQRQLSNNSTASIPVENGNCPPGYRIDQDRCYSCFPGSYTSGQESECFLCPKGFYMDKKAADSCWPCPDGKLTLAEGADSVDSCIYIGVDSRINNTLSTTWIIIGIFILIFLILSWILIIILLIRVCFPKIEDNEDKKYPTN